MVVVTLRNTSHTDQECILLVILEGTNGVRQALEDIADHVPRYAAVLLPHSWLVELLTHGYINRLESYTDEANLTANRNTRMHVTNTRTNTSLLFLRCCMI